MRDIFISTHGNLLDNWLKACPKALATVSVRSVPVSEPAIFWLHANANNLAWLEKTMLDIKQKFQVSKIVVLANSPSQAEAVSVMSNGAVGYCHAYSPTRVLKELKTVITHGGVWLGQDLLQTLIGASKELVSNNSDQVEKALALLTKREKEVALHAANGLSNKEIARILKITERTIKAHVSKSLAKLGVKDRLQLALVLNDKSDIKRESAQKTTKKTKVSKVPKSSKSTSTPKKRQSKSQKIKKKLELAA